MTHSFTRRTGALAMIGLAAATVVACSPPSDDEDATPAASGSGAADAKTSTSAEGFGGMDALVAAAKKEGALNVIALPAGLGELRRDHQGLPGQVPRASRSPATSPTAAAPTRSRPPSGSRDRPAPRTSSTSVRLWPWPTRPCSPPTRSRPGRTSATTSRSRPACGSTTTAATWASATTRPRCPAPTSVADLLKPAYKGKVALNGNPTEAGAAFAGVQMASVANGGTVGDLTKGVDFFSELNKAGNFLPVDPTPATDRVGPDPGRHRLGLPQRRPDRPRCRPGRCWSRRRPSSPATTPRRSTPTPRTRPLRGCGRSSSTPTSGQNLWLKGGARPVRFEAMKTAGTLDAGAAAALPPVDGVPIVPTQADAESGKTYLAANWANAVG